MTITDLSGRSAAEQFAAFNAWTTLAAQGIRITDYAEDFTSVQVRLELTAKNANYMGTAFGGSLFSMLDPFLVVLALNQLGPGYVVWDKAAEIDFVSPGTGSVTARIDLPATTVQELRDAAQGGAKVLRWFEITIHAEDGRTVAVAKRQLYVRERRPDQPAATAERHDSPNGSRQ